MKERAIEFTTAFFVLTLAFTNIGKASEREEIYQMISEALTSETLEATDQDGFVALDIDIGSERTLVYLGPNPLSPFLGAQDVFDLLQRYPVLCDESASYRNNYLECFRFEFESIATGKMLYRLNEDDNIVVDGYWKAPFEVTDYGLCQSLGQTESDVEIEILDEDDQQSVFDAMSVRAIFQVGDSTARNCFSFSYPEGGDALQQEPIINQVTISEFLGEGVRYFVSSDPMIMSDVWPFEP